MKFKQALLIVIVVLLCSSCQTIPESTPVVDSVVDSVIDILETNLTGIVGKLQDEQNNPIAGEVVRAAIVVWNEDKTTGNFIIDGARSPSTISDENGVFVLMNIPPQEYVIIVGDIEVDPIVIPESEGSNIAKIFAPVIDEILDVGILTID